MKKRGLVYPENLTGDPLVRLGICEEPHAGGRFVERHDVMLGETPATVPLSAK